MMSIVAVSAAPLVMPWEAAVGGMLRTAKKSSVGTAGKPSVGSAGSLSMIGMDTEAVVCPVKKVAVYDPPM